jgi:hypothetical protein
MKHWEHLRVIVHHREDGNLDYVAKIDNDLPSIATHDSMEGHFNAAPEKWNTYLQKLADSRWQLEKIDQPDKDGNETYHFKREKV